jgi:hypothetical protein
VIAAVAAGVLIRPLDVLSPAHPEEGHVRLGDAYLKQGRPEEAAAAYARAIEINPRYAPAREQLRKLEASPAGVPGTVISEIVNRAASRNVTSGAAPPPPPLAIADDDGWPAWLPLQPIVQQLSIRYIVRLRRAAVSAAGGSLVDTTTFDGWLGFVAYLPRALVIAFIAPFPWDLLSVSGFTGVFRPIAAAETLLITLLIPAIALGLWGGLRSGRPQQWLMVFFVVSVALGYGVMMPNGGSLFRVRLQFLFPALILASSSLPAVVYRWIEGAKRLMVSPVQSGKAGQWNMGQA